MSKMFLKDDFLLHTNTAKKLYAEVAQLPIIDYHCHLNPKEIAENKRFQNITQMWLYGDHYKWRLMRANGIDEAYITGAGDDFEKFVAWSETVDECIGSPLYHWTHLELKRYFDYDGILDKNTAEEVWNHCNKIIENHEFNVWNIFKKFNVEIVCTTDDPIDSLDHHKIIKEKNIGTKVLPTFRPSVILEPNHEDFIGYVQKLSELTGMEIKKYRDILNALNKRIDFFHEMSCRLSDHSLEPPVFEESTEEQRNSIIEKALQGECINDKETKQFQSALMIDLGKKYSSLGWTMQLHMSALRNNSSRMLNISGKDSGFDSISDVPVAYPLSRILDGMDQENELPKTIVYSLNPCADDILAAMVGNFQGGSVKGKIQFGSAWWFNDSKSGMEKQMTTLANMGMLSKFVGMLTDSRSFLSYTRHEYFRRIMVNLIGNWVENGEYPDDFNKLKNIASNIAYFNAKEYFQF